MTPRMHRFLRLSRFVLLGVLVMMVLFSRPLIILFAENVMTKAPAFWGIPKEAPSTGSSAKKGGAARA